MRLPRVRFTVRRLMVAVAIVGLTLGGWRLAARLARLRRGYQAQLVSHRFHEWVSRKYHDDTRTLLERTGARRPLPSVVGDLMGLGPTEGFLETLGEGIKREKQRAEYMRGVAMYKRWAEYHRAMASKYERALARPWLPVEPGPPMPE